MKKCVLVGSGGVGAVMGLALKSTEKVEVTMVIRSDYDTVTKDGYEFDSVDYGQIKNWRPHNVAKSIESAVQYGPFDYIFVSTKFIPEVQKTEEMIRPLVQDGAAIVLVQNGVGSEAPVAEAFPNSYVIGGVSMIGSTNYNGKIYHPTPDEVTFGTFDKREKAIELAKELADLYASSKSAAEFTDNLAYTRWRKLVYNSCFNTVSALTCTDTGRLHHAGLDDTIIRPAMREVRAIAYAELGVEFTKELEDFMLYSDEGIYYKPSMQVDVEKGQVMELEAILGNPLRVAHRLNVDAPVLRMIYLLLRPVQYRLLEKKGMIKTPDSFDRKAQPTMFSPFPWEE